MTVIRACGTVFATAICFALMCTAGHYADGKDRTLKLVVLGDSLTAGYGLPAADAFPTKLEQALRNAGQTVVVANAGVSGDTAAMGLARLDRSVPAGTDAVILELGANDMLRGFEPTVTRAALAGILGELDSPIATTAGLRSRFISVFCKSLKIFLGQLAGSRSLACEFFAVAGDFHLFQRLELSMRNRA